MAIGVAKRGQRQCLLGARPQHDIAFDENILHFAAISTAVHPHKSADCAGNPTQEFQSGDPAVAGIAGDAYARCAAAAF